MWNFLAALFALVGTVAQGLSNLRELSRRDPETASAVALWDLQDAKPSWLHPLRRREHMRIVEELKRESPAEARAYDRLYRTVLSWAVLATSAFLATIGSAIGLFHGSP
ncbi:hypothetical protein [Cellulomonas sp. SG140]|uniref:hypothetical protein n=1 Tax=Cellulomonas sp. SG140 TaxID=2976536 RepID=UPI0021E96AEB|nr:hypothetical protein [Cellulomonas sp. SG140]